MVVVLGGNCGQNGLIRELEDSGETHIGVLVFLRNPG
jgi:hypothetical protein